MNRAILSSIELEFRRWQDLGAKAIAQVPEDRLNELLSPESNTVASLVRHISGNLQSRFSDFLTTDGEKETRNRDLEFDATPLARAEIESLYSVGFATLTASLAALDDSHLLQTVTIRQVPLTVAEALHRSLAHIANHVGQILFLAKILTGPNWRYLTIAPGASRAYNQNPNLEKGSGG
jgi:hypothetical protein